MKIEIRGGRQKIRARNETEVVWGGGEIVLSTSPWHNTNTGV